jgi:hypothetical protein
MEKSHSLETNSHSLSQEVVEPKGVLPCSQEATSGLCPIQIYPNNPFKHYSPTYA